MILIAVPQEFTGYEFSFTERLYEIAPVISAGIVPVHPRIGAVISACP